MAWTSIKLKTRQRLIPPNKMPAQIIGAMVRERIAASASERVELVFL